MRNTWWVVMCVAVVACGPLPTTRDGSIGDAGEAPDAGTPPDSGEPSHDAGANANDAGVSDAGTPDAGFDAGPEPVDAGLWVTVSHQRELRAVWVATVLNLDFPAASRDAGIAELGRIVETSAANGINAIVFQVRPESDALYRSNREPWSRFLTGTQGRDPGYDPLAELVTLAHRRGLEVHAWVNPYRAKVSTTSTTAATHISRVLAQHAITYGTSVVMDPSAEAVRAWVVNEIGDLVTDYDVDGVHFDDYFYPYPIAGTPFPDATQYSAYQADGGTLTKLDWRRDNVNQLVRRVSETIATKKPFVRFGISPFGIYKSGVPVGITGLNAYDEIACDPLAWLGNGWVDYVAPQLYWRTNQTGQEFGKLIAWWAQQVTGGRSVFAGHALSQLGTTSSWSLQELRTQVQLTRAQYPNAAGSVWFRYAMLRDNVLGVSTTFTTDFYPRPALPPPLATQRSQVVQPPSVSGSGSMVTIAHAMPDQVRAYTLYRESLGQWQLERIVPSSEGQVSLTSGRWAIAAVSRADVESQGVVVDVP